MALQDLSFMVGWIEEVVEKAIETFLYFTTEFVVFHSDLNGAELSCLTNSCIERESMEMYAVVSRSERLISLGTMHIYGSVHLNIKSMILPWI